MQMTRYKQADFADEDTSSVGSVHLTETTSHPVMHIRYHTARVRLLYYPRCYKKNSYNSHIQGTSMWRARTKLEKCLLLSQLGLIVLFILCLTLYIASSPNDNATRILHVQPHSTGPCLNESCIHAASEILHSIDLSVNPCDDFYAFSCNQWIKNNPIPDGKSMWGTFGKLEQRNQLVVKNVLGKCR